MEQDNKTKRQRDIEFAREYLATGGLGEVIGFIDIALSTGQPKVQCDSDMAMALCLLASEALAAPPKPAA